MNRNSIDIRHLRYFAAIAEAGSFTRAAAHLHIAQPALSQHVRNLELALGVQLFDRGARGVRLTREGKKLLTHARRVLNEMNRLVDAVSTEVPAGEVSLGLPIPVSPLVTQPLVATMQQHYSDVTLHITEGMSAHLAEWLSDARLDAAVLFANQELVRLDCREICVEPLYVVGPPGAFTWGETVPFRDVQRYSLIMPDKRNGLRDLVHNAAAAQGVEFTIKFEIDVISELKQFVERGLGYSLLAPIVFHKELIEGRVSAARIVEPELTRTWTLATRKSRKQNAACRAVTEATVSILINQTSQILENISRLPAAPVRSITTRSQRLRASR